MNKAMNREDIRALVQHLSQRHRNDRDGGRALVAALAQAHEGLHPEQQREFYEILAESVRAQDPELWAVALETLVQLGQNDAVALLAGELIHGVSDEARRDYVVLGLLRLSLTYLVPKIVEHVRDSLRKPRSLTVPMVAAICRIDQEIGLELSADYFEFVYSNLAGRDVEAEIAAFVRNLVEIQELLLPELVRRVILREPDAGRWLARGVSDYLSKPWMIDDLGGDRCRNLRAKVDATEHTLN